MVNTGKHFENRTHTCHLMAHLNKLDEELQCMALVHALSDEYHHLSSTLLLVDKLDKAMILQAFRSEELNRQRNVELVNKARAFGKGSTNLADVLCYYCKKKGHTTHNCPPLKAKLEKEKKAEGAKKTEGEKAAAVAEFAGQASVKYVMVTCPSIYISRFFPPEVLSFLLRTSGQ